MREMIRVDPRFEEVTIVLTGEHPRELVPESVGSWEVKVTL